MVRYLPGEITDIIIACVWPDANALCKCALVCHNWLPASKFWLYHRVAILRSERRYDLFVSRILHDERMKPWLATVRSFTFLECVNRGDGPDFVKSVDPERSRGHRLIHDIACHLPNLLVLDIRDMDWSQRSPHPSAYIALSQFTAVRHFSLSHCKLPSFGALRRALVALPVLAALNLDKVQWPPTPEGVPIIANPCAARPALESLRFTSMSDADSYLQVFLLWISQTRTRVTLRKLAFEPSSFTKQADFFALMASFITSLELVAFNKDETLEIPLSSFDQLRSLTVSWTSRDKDWAQLSSSLKSVQSRLSALYFTIDGGTALTTSDRDGDSKGVEVEGLDLLDTVLEGDAFKDLRVVAFQIFKPYASSITSSVAKSVALDVYRAKLPKLFARGIVELTVHQVHLAHTPAS